MLEPILYRHLNLTRTRHQSDKAYRTLANRQDLIPYMRKYRGPLAPSSLPLPKQRFGSRKRPKSYKERLVEAKGFKNMTSVLSQALNINDLNFWDTVGWASDPIWEPVTRAVCKMRLVRLVYSVGREDHKICQLLQTQTHLERLSLGGDTRHLDGLDKTALPKLRYLDAKLQEACIIVPGRPIEELHIYGYGEIPGIDDPLFRKLSLSTRAIRIFSLGLLRGRDEIALPSIFKVIALNLPELEQLTLKFGDTVSARVVGPSIPLMCVMILN